MHCGLAGVTCSSGSVEKKVLWEPARGEVLPATSCVCRAAGPRVSELPDPQTFCGRKLHFWPEALRSEPKAASSPRGPAGRGGSEQVGRGQRSPGCERLRLGPVLQASSLGLGQRR